MFKKSVILKKQRAVPVAESQKPPQAKLHNRSYNTSLLVAFGEFYCCGCSYNCYLGNIRLSYKDKNKNGSIETGVKTIWQDDFESASGWDGSGASWGWSLTEFDTQKKHKGNYSARVEAPQGHSRVTHSNEWVQIQNSEPTDYIYSCWAYSESPVIRLGLAMKEDGETEYLTLFDDIRDYNRMNKWVYIEKRVTVPAHITSINLRLESGAWGNRVGSVWFDDVKIVELSKGDTEIVEEKNYYPFGLKHKGYNNVVNGTENNYFTYNGKELEEELGKNTLAFQWRDYDPAIARFNKIDRFAEKYYQENPYHFSGNNPIIFREIAGDSVTLARVVVHDKVNNTNHQQTITNELQNVTGLTLTVDANTGVLGYAKDANGNAIISSTTDANGNVTQNGSASARTDLMGVIDANGVIDVGIDANRSTTNGPANSITLGESQIDGFVNGTPSQLNDRTMGYGMTLMHEFEHTQIGGLNKDPTDPTSTTSTGPVVNRVNVYRNELDNNPNNAGARPYGQRSQIYATPNSSGSGGSIRFKYQTTNSRGRTVNRTATIRY